MSLQIVARLNQHRLSASPKLLFEHQTIAALAPWLGRGGEAGAGGQTQEVAGEVTLTPIQHWFFEQPLERPQHWNHALLLGSGARLDGAALRRALQALLDHHDALRMGY